MRKRKLRRLPRKLSECLMLALEDLEVADRSSKFTVDMGAWYSRNKSTGHCVVCLAGSVMALSLQHTKRVRKTLTERSSTNPCDYSRHNSDRLYALNYLRMGGFFNALLLISKDCYYDPILPHQLRHLFGGYQLGMKSSMNHRRSGEWREHMIWIAGILKAEGL